MNLKTYIEKRWINVSSFSREIGVTTQYIYNIMREEKKVSVKIAIKIYELTNGEVVFDKIGKHPKEVHKDPPEDSPGNSFEDPPEDSSIFIPVTPEEAHLIKAMKEITTSLNNRVIKYKKCN